MQQLIDLIKQNGGTAMLVGGAVIDSIQNREIKDFDVEVYGLSYESLVNILTDLNLPINVVGKSFGIIKTCINDDEIDLSIPRTENKHGIGHKGFEVCLNSTLTPFEAGLRRDLTINSMYLNLHTNELVDPFNGLSDLNDGILRATNATTFVEDPLRVLRIMQLLARKGKSVAPETIELCKSISDKFNELPKERIFEEFKKLLLKSNKPSLGLEFLKQSDWLKHFPALNDLVNCEQNLIWHPEGDVWNHTMLVVDNAASVLQNIPEDLQLSFMFGALLHDIGKPATTAEDLTSKGHDGVGSEMVESFMNILTDEIKLIENVSNLVRLHMRSQQLVQSKAGLPAWKRLHNQFRLDVLGWLSKCDSNGRLGRTLETKHETSEICFKYFEKLGTERIKPIICGKDLIQLGVKPGIELGLLLKQAYELQLDGFEKDEIINQLNLNA